MIVEKEKIHQSRQTDYKHGGLSHRGAWDKEFYNFGRAAAKMEACGASSQPSTGPKEVTFDGESDPANSIKRYIVTT